MSSSYRAFYEAKKHIISGLIPPECLGLGDVVERIAKPVAKVLNLPCLDENKKLRPESPCAKRRDKLNRMLPFNQPK